MESHAPQPRRPLATLLHAASLLYEQAVRRRQRWFDTGRLTKARLPRPVISIGNLTAGGTGKTPMTLHLARLVHGLGLKPAVLSRGYKGAAEKRGRVVSDGRQILCTAGQAGDEPVLMARLLEGRVPVVVGRDRHAAGLTAIQRFNPDLLLLDDGYQHQQLARDLNILLLDARAPFGNSFLLPRGTLREPLTAAARADLVVFTRCDDSHLPAPDHLAALSGSPPVFRARHRPVLRGIVPAGRRLGDFDWSGAAKGTLPQLAGRDLVAFSGLARNREFWRSISRLGGRLTATLGFDDHHGFRSRDIQAIVSTARKVDCDTLATTDKDLVRLPADGVLPLDLMVLGAAIDLGADASRWRDTLTRRLKSICKPSA